MKKISIMLLIIFLFLSHLKLTIVNPLIFNFEVLYLKNQ